MHAILYLFLVLGSFLYLAPLSAEEAISRVEQLITSTEKQLLEQKKLKEQMVLFEKQKELFMQGEQTLPHASLMVKTATHILTMISDHHLQHLFTPEYMQELALFTSIGSKKGPARP